MKRTDIPIHNPNIIFRTENDGYSLAFNIITQDLLTFNGSASEIWNLIDGKRNVDDIVTILAESYSMNPGEIKDPVYKTFKILAKTNCITSRDIKHGK